MPFGISYRTWKPPAVTLSISLSLMAFVCLSLFLPEAAHSSQVMTRKPRSAREIWRAWLISNRRLRVWIDCRLEGLTSLRPMPIRHTLQPGWGVMSKFERLLEAGSTELPDCRCSAEMSLMATLPMDGGDTEIRIFRCPYCSHELRLTAWRNVTAKT